MIAMIGPIAFAVSVVLFLLRSRVQARRRASQSWGDLVSRLQSGWDASQLGDGLRDQNVTPQERWQQLHGARGLCVMYSNAKVMLEMADFAARNSDAVDANILEQLRSDAMQIRVSVVVTLTQYAMHQLNERISANALRAASVYTEMTERMGELLQGGQLAPAFVGAR
jgi:hypothetical protein